MNGLKSVVSGTSLSKLSGGTEINNGSHWETLDPIANEPFHDFSIVTYRLSVYVFGGLKSNIEQSDCYIFKNEKWKLIQQLSKQRIRHTSIVYNNDIYHIGGHYNELDKSPIERWIYDSQSDSFYNQITNLVLDGYNDTVIFQFQTGLFENIWSVWSQWTPTNQTLTRTRQRKLSLESEVETKEINSTSLLILGVKIKTNTKVGVNQKGMKAMFINLVDGIESAKYTEFDYLRMPNDYYDRTYIGWFACSYLLRGSWYIAGGSSTGNEYNKIRIVENCGIRTHSILDEDIKLKQPVCAVVLDLAYMCSPYDYEESCWSFNGEQKGVYSITGPHVSHKQGLMEPFNDKPYAFSSYRNWQTEEYDPVTKRWSYVNEFPPEFRDLGDGTYFLFHSASVVLRGEIYIFGGSYGGEGASGRIFKINRKQKWEKINSELKQARKGHSAILFNGSIYIVFGRAQPEWTM